MGFIEGNFFICSIKKLPYIKEFAYFDPLGFGCLSRRERRSVEVNILETQGQFVFLEEDEEGTEQRQSNTNKQGKGEQSSTSSMSKFLSSIGKRNSFSSFNIKSTNRNTLNEELATYRLLAQKEYNSIVDNDKVPDVVSYIQLNEILFTLEFLRFL